MATCIFYIACVTNSYQASAAAPAPTRPRLQSVNQDFSNLNEQIRQVAHIIRLPDGWMVAQERDARSVALQHVVRARAEWVLRWILDKLKDETETGTEARGTPVAWQLLECMIHMLPVSRSAPHLRDASFTTILERTLVENFDRDLESPSVPKNDDVDMRDDSESSETIHEESQPSRKRKRGTAQASPSKRTALASADPAVLFRVIRAVLKSITDLTTTDRRTHDNTQMELMKMVLRTESDQAARILKFWLTGVRKLLAISCNDLEHIVDLSMVFEVWDMRIADSGDNTGSSSEDFANECLVPALQLVEALRNLPTSDTSHSIAKALDTTAQALDKLLGQHLLAPSRVAFFTETPVETSPSERSHREALVLSSSLNPLRAMLLQAAQIEDAGEALPSHFSSLFKAVPYLLDLAIRASPSRTPKTRLAERPWIQAVFLSLSECAGCSLKTPPEFVTPNTAVAALESALRVLQTHGISLTTAILKDLFWYHCGVKYPERTDRKVHWTLIAALVELDPSIFVAEPRSSSNSSIGRPIDLAEFLFALISDAEVTGNLLTDVGQPSADVHVASIALEEVGPRADHTLILARIVVPMITAFSRNRNLLGFIRRWDDQLVKSYNPENRKALKERTDPIWENRILTTALSDVFEQSLTQGQIAKLIEEHAKRMEELSSAVTVQMDESVKVRKLPAYKKASSSAIIIPAILQSVRSDEVVGALKMQLHSLFISYATRVRDDRFSTYTRLASSWLTLCQLMAKLWPIEMHSSLKLQQMLLHPLIEQAVKDLNTGRKTSDGRLIDSTTRTAAIVFLLDACDRLQTVPGSEQQVQNGLRKIVKSLSASQLEAEDHIKMMEFCVGFVQLLDQLDTDACRDSLITLLSRLVGLEDDAGERISGLLSQAVSASGSTALHNAYTSALLNSLALDKESRCQEIAVKAVSHLQPSAMSRERREAILNQLTTLATTSLSDPAGALAAMVQLMHVPNASAKISTDGAVLFDVSSQLQKQGSKSPSVLQSLQHLCQNTLGHIIPNQTQAQSRAFLAEYQKTLNSMTQGSNKVSPVGLALLRATVLEQKDAQLLSVKQYVTLLKKCLTDDGADAEETASFEDVLDALNELFPALLVDANLIKSTTTWLRTWISDNADLESYLASSNSVSIEVAEYVTRLHKLVTKYRLYPDTTWLIRLTAKVLRESIADNVRRSALATLAEALVALETPEKLALVPLVTDVQDALSQPASYLILSELISTLPDKVSTDAKIKKKQFALLPRLCFLLAEVSNDTSFNALMDGIDTILNRKASLTTQHSIECVLSVLVKLTSRTSPALSSSNASNIFTRICETSRLALLVHRNKLGGRSHILLPLLQGLLFCLFMPTSTRSGALPSWLRSTSPTEAVRLTSLSASQYTRLLSTLCNPPQSSISKSHQHSRKSRDLNDPIKAARERTSHFLYPLLASFCRFQLAGRLDPVVRVKLMPGIWEVVGTASLHKEGLDAMFAGLGRSEKDVWRGLWGEWESVHGRKEKFVGEELA